MSQIAALLFVLLRASEAGGLLQLDRHAANTALAGTALWALISLLTTLDPNPSEKIATATESLNTLRPGGR